MNAAEKRLKAEAAARAFTPCAASTADEDDGQVVYRCALAIGHFGTHRDPFGLCDWPNRKEGPVRATEALAKVETAGRILSGALQEAIAASGHNAACRWDACVCWIEPARKRLEAWRATLKALGAPVSP